MSEVNYDDFRLCVVKWIRKLPQFVYFCCYIILDCTYVQYFVFFQPKENLFDITAGLQSYILRRLAENILALTAYSQSTSRMTSVSENLINNSSL